MSDTITIQVPSIDAISFSSNSSTINQTITISVLVTEKTVNLSSEERYSCFADAANTVGTQTKVDSTDHVVGAWKTMLISV